MLRSNHLRFFLFFLFMYCLIAAVVLSGHFPDHDTLYYWAWSQHLSTGYYDGPLFIAYYVKAFTWLLGSTAESIVAMGLISHLLMSVVLYFLAMSVFAEKKVAYLAVIIWLFTPFIFVMYGLRVTYDTPVCLFALLTLFCFYEFHKKQRLLYLYAAALCGALMLLSKYTGVSLFLGLLALIVFSKHYRYLLKNRHVYIAFFLSTFIFLSVVIWNAIHGVADGLFYQSHHVFHTFSFEHFNMVVRMILSTLGYYNVWLIPFALFLKRYFFTKASDARMDFLSYPVLTIFLFFFICSFSFFIANWSLLFYNTIPIAVAYLAFQSQFWRKATTLIVTVLAMLLFVLALFVSNYLHLSFFQLNINQDEHTLAMEIAPVAKHYSVIYSNKWYLNSLIEFYVRGSRIYAFDDEGNQFIVWSQHENQLLQAQKIPVFLYLTEGVLDHHFKGYHCDKVLQTKHWLTTDLLFGRGNWHISGFRCIKT